MQANCPIVATSPTILIRNFRETLAVAFDPILFDAAQLPNNDQTSAADKTAPGIHKPRSPRYAPTPMVAADITIEDVIRTDAPLE